MSLYIRELVKHLDKENKHWRNSCCLIHDGASYSRNPGFISVLKELHVPFMMSAPHSYNTAWVELLFGAIKTGVLNPEDQLQGKGNFKGMVKMIFDKLRSIPKHQRILWYHHCLGHFLRFLLFEQL